MNNIKLVASDLDGTLIHNIVWRRAQALVGVSYEEANDWYIKYYKNQITFDELNKHFSSIYDKNRKTLKDFLTLNKYVRLIAGAKKTVKSLKERYPFIIVSSGMDFYVKEAARLLGIEKWYANYQLIIDERGFVRTIKPQYPDQFGKVELLKIICSEYNILPEEIAFIGDSINDLNAFQFTKRGILIGRGTDLLRQNAWKCIETIPDLIDIFRE